MSTTTIYKCDACNREMSVNELNQLEINRYTIIQGKTYHYFDICSFCLDNLIKGFNLVREDNGRKFKKSCEEKQEVY